jgi:glucose/arabinose dehydrogenase
MNRITWVIKICCFSLSLGLGIIACTAESAKDSVPKNNVQPISNQIEIPNSALIPTQILEIKQYALKIEDLPLPYTTESASKQPKITEIPANPRLKVPQGFKVNVFAANLNRPRWMSLTPEGDVLVAESYDSRLRLLKDRDRDGVAESDRVFATEANGINQPLGMAFTDNSFYVANTGNVLRFDYRSGQEKLEGTGKEITQLTPGGYNQHWTRNLLISPDEQKLYVSVGSQSNVEPEELPRASIQVMNLDGSQRETYASGLRNPVGMDFHPVTKELYTTVNERDLIGDDLVPDYLTRVQPGGFYGWPYAYLAPDLLDPRRLQGNVSERPDLVAKTITPDVLFQAHSAALGLQFYDGQQFPERYRNGAFVAFRGSWNRNSGTGYKVVFVPFGANNRPLGYYEDFLTGFLTDPAIPSTWARPVGLLVLPDGSLLLAEDGNSTIYRISFD